MKQTPAQIWWFNLPNELKSQFPHLNPTNEEIEMWYDSPADYSLPPNITY